MALISCPECNKLISEITTTCPLCGYSYVQEYIFQENQAKNSYYYWLDKFKSKLDNRFYSYVGIYNIKSHLENEWSNSSRSIYTIVEDSELKEYLETAYQLAPPDKKEEIKEIMVKNIDLAYPEAVKLKAKLQEEDRRRGKCYIATAIYGDYDAPETKILRKYRDEHLEKNVFGRLLVKIYYTLSPPIARYLKNAKLINRFVKFTLDAIVGRLSK